MLSRRGFCLALASAPLLMRTAWAEGPRSPIILSPRLGVKPAMSILNPRDWTVRDVQVPMLAHSIVGHPVKRHLVYLMGQRPERRSCVVDLGTGSAVQIFEASKGRHFYGHGVFSPNGETLYATETDNKTGQGFIVVRNAQSLTITGEIPSFGMAPHELSFTADASTLIIANGGAVSIEGEDYAGGKQTRSRLCYVDIASGKLVESVSLEDESLSLRHMAVLGRDVVLGLRRYGKEGPARCVAFHRRGEPLFLPEVPAAQLAQQKSLALSVAIDGAGRFLLATHPDGGAVSVWSLRERRFVAQFASPGPEGCAPFGDGFVVTTQSGETKLVRTSSLEVSALPASANGPNWKHSLLWTTA